MKTFSLLITSLALSTFAEPLELQADQEWTDGDLSDYREEKNRELTEVCIHYPDEKLSGQVRDFIFFTPSPKERASLDYIGHLGYTSKEGGIAPLKNRPIAIDAQFWLDTLSRGLAKAQGEICKEGECEASTKIVSELLPKIRGFLGVGNHLRALGRGEIAPKTLLEREVQPIMDKYIKREAQLIEKDFPKVE